MAEFKIHDITVRHQPFFNPNGTTGLQWYVQFFVDHHGPFVIVKGEKEYSPALIRKEMEQKVAELREIHGDFGGPGSGA